VGWKHVRLRVKLLPRLEEPNPHLRAIKAVDSAAMGWAIQWSFAALGSCSPSSAPQLQLSDGLSVRNGGFVDSTLDREELAPVSVLA